MLPAEFLRTQMPVRSRTHSRSQSWIRQLVGQAKIRDNGDIYWPILYDRGRIAEKEGDLKSAIDFYRRAVDVIEQQR